MDWQDVKISGDADAMHAAAVAVYRATFESPVMSWPVIMTRWIPPESTCCMNSVNVI